MAQRTNHSVLLRFATGHIYPLFRFPEGFFDLVQMTRDLIAAGVTVKVCGTCQARCGIRKGDPYYEGTQKSTMGELSQWVRESEKVLTF